MNYLLSVNDLAIEFKTASGVHKALNHVSFGVKPGG